MKGKTKMIHLERSQPTCPSSGKKYRARNPAVAADNPVVAADNPAVASDNPAVAADNPAVAVDKWIACNSKQITTIN